MIVRVLGHGNAGLKLFVERSGTKDLKVRARVNGGQPNDMPLGKWPDAGIAEARRRKAQADSDIAHGEDRWKKRAEAKRRRDGITLDEVLEQQASEVGIHCAPSTRTACATA